jgi:competence ComEA-like helix-hairpin-helix protein
MKAWLRHYFGFTARESRGFLIVMSFLFFVLLAPTLYDFLAPETAPIEVTIKELKVDSALAILRTEAKKENQMVALVAFDPNTATEKELMGVGFPSFLAKRTMKYREKGGRFRKKTDVKKLYGMSPELYSRLESYILLPDSLPYAKKGDPVKGTGSPRELGDRKPFLLDMNSADTLEWKKIRGIGSVLALRIVKFRERLGGFAFKEQLFEVYGLDSAVVQDNWEVWTLKTSPKKLAVNTMTAEELAKHPYIGKKNATLLVRYREQHGEFQKPEDLLAIKILDPMKVRRLAPYLEF